MLRVGNKESLNVSIAIRSCIGHPPAHEVPAKLPVSECCSGCTAWPGRCDFGRRPPGARSELQLHTGRGQWLPRQRFQRRINGE